MERVFAYFARPGGLEDNKGTRGLEEFQSLEFDKVYFKYPASDEYVLKGASFIIHKGDKVSLVGINGAGKSTMIKIMLGLSDLGRMNDEGSMKEAMHRSGVMNFFSAFYDGFDTYITKKFTDDGAELSKGQHQRLSQDKTGIMISHRISGSRLVGKILVLDGGIIAECGTHEELIKKKEGIYANLYARQKNKYKTGGSGAE